MKIEIVTTKGPNTKTISTIEVKADTTVKDIKKELYKQKKAPYCERQSLRAEAKGKSLSDKETVKSLGLNDGATLFYKDLGPQIGWKTVFLAEYAGPLAVYLWIYTRPWIFYGEDKTPMPPVVHLAAVCYSIHYIKRLYETIYVHRFSHSTMPMRNLFKNCAYYWLFTAYVAYHVNHPLYTAPSIQATIGGFLYFILCEYGNYSVHIALRDLRPPGTTVRRIPMPSRNPLTLLFFLVSCPNYTYEVGSWLGFTIMTQCLPAGFFTVAGAVQMTIWALGKHRAYRKEFPDYPKNRDAIFPYFI